VRPGLCPDPVQPPSYPQTHVVVSEVGACLVLLSFAAAYGQCPRRKHQKQHDLLETGLFVYIFLAWATETVAEQ
jgi:hypothetical protein